MYGINTGILGACAVLASTVLAEVEIIARI
jgi:hypothetical protein